MKSVRFMTIVFILLALGSPAAAFAGELDDLVRGALENNPGILAAEETWSAAEAGITTARAWPDPQVGIRFERNPGAVYSLGEARMRMVSISQTIPFPGKLSLRAEMFTRDAHKARWEYEAARQEIIAQVKTAYYDLFVLQRSVELLQEQSDLLAAFERTARVNYMVGRASQHDVLRAQVELALLKDDLETLDREDVVTARARLNTLLDRPALSPLELSGAIDIAPMTLSGERLEQIAWRTAPIWRPGRR